MSALGKRTSSVYVHIDLDVLDPAGWKANAFTKPGGMTAEALIELLRRSWVNCPIEVVAFTAYDPALDEGDAVGQVALQPDEVHGGPSNPTRHSDLFNTRQEFGFKLVGCPGACQGMRWVDRLRVLLPTGPTPQARRLEYAMRYPVLFAPLSAAFLVAGCDAAPAPVGLEPISEPAFSHGAPATATGGGVFDAGVPVNFAFGAVQMGPGGSAKGHLRFSTELGGLAITFRGEVTCMTSDPGEGRAWIGGVITGNDSEHPSFTGDIHQVGKDIWFRVVDYGPGGAASQPDRTTFVGFEGGGGIDTSAEYCEMQIWPEGDARTGPVLEGNIRVGG